MTMRTRLARTPLILVAIAALGSAFPTTAAEADRARRSERRLGLAPLGPPWGRLIPGASGHLSWKDPMPRRLQARLVLAGLPPRRPFVACVHVEKGQAGYDLLADRGRYVGDRYVDLASVMTDAHGRIDTSLNEDLPPGRYAAKLLIKDQNERYAVVLHNDHFGFEVAKDADAAR